MPNLPPGYAPHEAAYYGTIKALGLRPTANSTVFLDSENWPWSVPSPVGKSPEQLDEILANIKRRMNILPRRD